jgi:inner membrane transporter RhtA
VSGEPDPHHATAGPATADGSRHWSSVTDHVPAWSLAIGAIISVQIGAGLSTHLFPLVGAGGTAWLRLLCGGVVFLLIARPDLHGLGVRELRVPLVLGVVTGVMTVSFLAALDRIPLGTAVAIEFLGPLGVAVARSQDRRALAWPVLALLGVLCLTRPWTGEIDPLGVLFAAIAGSCWATYILLTQVVGDRFTGLQGLALTIPVAAFASAAVGVPQAWGHVTWQVLLVSFGLALLLPVIPFSLELVALRRLTAAAFGTLMALEPAVATAVGLLLLHQVPAPVQALGVALVVVAGIGAERRGHRDDVGQPSLEPPGTA